MRKSIYSVLLLVLSFTSCQKENPEPALPVSDNLIITALPNPGGETGVYYMQMIGDLLPSSYDNKKAIPTPFMAGPCLHGDDVYVMPGWDSQQEVVKYTRTKDGRLQKQGALPIPPKSGASVVTVQSSEKAYMSLAHIGKIMIFNPSTMAKTGEIDITEYGVSDKNPNPAAMIIRDGLLFVGLRQTGSGYYPKHHQADMLLIDTKTDKVVKLISQKEAGFSDITRAVDQRSIFMDEKGDIYVNCYGGYGAEGHKAGILRIKEDETEFDRSYALDPSSVKAEGVSEAIEAFHWLQYAGNGKMYAIANVPAYASSSDWVSSRSAIAVEVDLYQKTIRKLDLPRTSVWGSVGLHQNTIVFGLDTDKDQGFYLYNLATKEASKEAVVKTAGKPILYRHFGEKY